MSLPSLLDTVYPRNPHYGKGIYRRRVRLNAGHEHATGIVNDDFHAMWIRIFHDGATILNTDAGMLRWPKTTCPGAIQVVHEIIDFPLSVSRRTFYGNGRAGRNCTHLLDLAFWLTGRIRRGHGESVIDIEIPDRINGETRMKAIADGQLQHDWVVKDTLILDPAELADLNLFSGFAAKCEERLSGLALESAWMLQKAAFVAQGREFVVDGLPSHYAREESHRSGACFAFSEPSFSIAEDNAGYVQDFTQGLHELFPPHIDSKPDNEVHTAV